MATMAQKIADLSEKLEGISQSWHSSVNEPYPGGKHHHHCYVAHFSIGNTYTCTRKHIYDSGDITYEQKLYFSQTPLDFSTCFYSGSTNVDVCELCKDHTNSEWNVDSRWRHAKGVPYYKQSERDYERKDYERPPTHPSDGERKEFLEDIEYDEVVNTCNQLHKNGVQMPASVKYMDKKDSVMRELYSTCICKKSVKTARWWFQPPLGNGVVTGSGWTVTDVDTPEDVVRQRLIRREGVSFPVGEDWAVAPLLSKVCTFEKQECDCLCACGHRRI